MRNLMILKEMTQTVICVMIIRAWIVLLQLMRIQVKIYRFIIFSFQISDLRSVSIPIMCKEIFFVKIHWII